MFKKISVFISLFLVLSLSVNAGEHSLSDWSIGEIISGPDIELENLNGKVDFSDPECLKKNKYAISRIESLCSKIIKNSPDSNAADEAEQILNKINGKQ